MLSLGVEPRISTLLVWRLTNLAIKAMFLIEFSVYIPRSHVMTSRDLGGKVVDFEVNDAWSITTTGKRSISLC